MAIIVILAILFSCILLILCLPVSYALTIHMGTPFHIEGQGRWGRKLADASWSYTLGEEPHHELHMCWKRSPAVKESVEPPPPAPEEEEKSLGRTGKKKASVSRMKTCSARKGRMLRHGVTRKRRKKRNRPYVSSWPASSMPTF